MRTENTFKPQVSFKSIMPFVSTVFKTAIFIKYGEVHRKETIPLNLSIIHREITCSYDKGDVNISSNTNNASISRKTLISKLYLKIVNAMRMIISRCALKPRVPYL